MRSSSLLWLAAPLVAFVFQGCSDDPAPANAAQVGGDDVADAAPDTTTTPAGDVDAAVPPVPQGPVTVVVTSDQGLVAGARVVFYDPSGATTILTTGADGKATHVMKPGGSVLVARTVEASHYLTSILEVEPNDVLQVGPPLASPIGSVPPSKVKLTSFQGFSGATAYTIDVGCDGGEIREEAEMTNLEVAVDAKCQGPGGKVWVLVSAVDGDAIAYAAKEVTFTPSAQIANLDIGAGDWTAAKTGTFQLTGTPPAGLTKAIVFASHVRNGRPYLTSGTSVPGKPLEATFELPPGTSFPGLFLSEATVIAGAGPGGAGTQTWESVLTVAKQEAPPAALPVTRSFSEFLPRLHSLKVSGTVQPEISWSSDAPVTAIGGIANARAVVERDAQTFELSWRIVFPAKASSVKLPPLPPELSAFGGTGAFEVSSVALIDSPELGSYRTFRNRVAEGFTQGNWATFSPQAFTGRSTSIEPIPPPLPPDE